MNYDRVILELLDRIAKLEEKTNQLETVLMQQTSFKATNTEEDGRKTRDKTKYVFDGHVCLKNRLVLEIVSKYVGEHQGISFDDLRSEFYDKLQGSFGVVRLKAEIGDKQRIRYFFNAPIILSDGTEVVVSNQWGKDNIQTFIVLAKSLGYEITEL